MDHRTGLQSPDLHLGRWALCQFLTHSWSDADVPGKKECERCGVRYEKHPPAPLMNTKEHVIMCHACESGYGIPLRQTEYCKCEVVES